MNDDYTYCNYLVIIGMGVLVLLVFVLFIVGFYFVNTKMFLFLLKSCFIVNRNHKARAAMEL